jgi:3',5'-cyclic-AMP phosphodiesterase
MNAPENRPSYSRRRFLQQLLGAGALAAAGVHPLLGQVTASSAQPFRFAFVTDLHLLENGDLHSVLGIAACLGAVEALNPKPDFIIVGGDLVDKSRVLTVAGAEKSMDLFLKTWNASTALPAHWIFGNHDLVATSNKTESPDDPNYGKGLFKRSLHLPRTFYSFDHKGWHFVVLDDIALDSNRLYYGALGDDELTFLKADLDAHRHQPTIVCTHIPIISNLPMGIFLTGKMAPNSSTKTLVCTNGSAVTDATSTHNIRAVLAGHLHFQEEIELNGVKIVNCGAVCADYWKGPRNGCPEGFGIVDVGADGSVAFNYHPYGWNAAV